MAIEALRQLGGMFNMDDNETECTASPSIVCETCGQHFQSNFEVLRHSRLCQAQTQMYTCSLCNQDFVRMSDLTNHVVCHEVDRPHACRVCGNVYRNKADLQNHLITQHPERPYQCPECGVNFQRPSSLTNHMKIHSYHPGRGMVTSTNKPSFSNIKRQDIKGEHSYESQTYSSFTSITMQEAITGSDPILDEAAIAAKNLQACNSFDSRELDFNCWSNSSKNSIKESVSSDTNQTSSIVNDQLAQFTNQLEDNVQNEAMNLFEFIEVPSVCATVDVETTEENDQQPSEKETHSFLTGNLEIKYSDHVFHGQSFNNGAVRVETLPYFLPGESQLQAGEFDVKMGEMNLAPEVVLTPDNSTNQRPHVCPHCNKTFSRAKALASHARVHLNEWGEVPESLNRDENFSNSASQAHLDQHRVNAPIAPTQRTGISCEDGTINGGRISDLSTQQSKEKHWCTKCDKKFTTRQKLSRHMWIHRKKQYVCEVCSLTVDHQEALEEHRQAQHPGKTPHVCQTCGRGFASRQGLWEHSRVHGNSNATHFRCSNCNKTFSSRQGYLIHTRTHTGERPYGCRFCMKAFRDGGTLRKHERIHTGERPHVCPLCFRAFNQKVVLREHVRWVHAANRNAVEDSFDSLFVCKVCNHVLGDQEQLCAHIVKHSDDMAKAAKAGSQPIVKPIPASKPPKVSIIRRGKKSRKQYSSVPPDPSKTKPSSTQNGSTHSLNRSVVQSRQVSASGEVNSVPTCEICDETFSNVKQLLKHVRIHI